MKRKKNLLAKKRGGGNWLLKGDNNTSYFYGIANGRKRKCTIRKLIDEKRVVLVEEEDIKQHQDQFFKALFGSEPEPNIKLGEDVCIGVMEVI